MMTLIILGCSEKDFVGADVYTNQQDAYVCFSETPDEPLIVHAVPYTSDAVQSNTWRAVFDDDSQIDFEMGRAAIGSIRLSSDGTWGAVAQENGSIGIFQQQSGTIEVIEERWFPTYENERLFATNVWLDPLQDRLWIVDGNLSLKGGLYVAPLDCESKTLGALEKVLPSEHGGALSFIDDPNLNTVYVGRHIDEGPQIRLFNRYDVEIPYHTFDAFPDSEAIFSAMASNGNDLLIGDNNAFSGLGNRVTHINIHSGNNLGTFAVEDPMAIIVESKWALIASGFGNAIYLYNLDTQQLTELTLSSPSQLPHSITAHNGKFYVGEYNGIREITMDSEGYVSDRMLLRGQDIEGIFGPFGIVGTW